MTAVPVDRPAVHDRARRIEDRLGPADRRRQPQQIAQYLHDELAQLLALALLRLDEARAGAAPMPAPQARLQAQARQLVHSALRSTRQVIEQLQPLPPAELGDAVAARIHALSGRYRLPIHLRRGDALPTPPAELTELLLAALQELCSNAARHGGSAIEVELVAVATGLALRVQDRGPGFDPQAPAASARADGGFGLPSLRARLAHAGLNLRLRSSPGQGVCAEVLWPGPGKAA